MDSARIFDIYARRRRKESGETCAINYNFAHCDPAADLSIYWLLSPWLTLLVLSVASVWSFCKNQYYYEIDSTQKQCRHFLSLLTTYALNLIFIFKPVTVCVISPSLTENCCCGRSSSQSGEFNIVLGVWIGLPGNIGDGRLIKTGKCQMNSRK